MEININPPSDCILTHAYSLMSTPQDLYNLLLQHPPHLQMAPLLLLMHPPRRQNIKNRILLQEMANQHPAHLVVVPLFLFRVHLTSGLIQFCQQTQWVLVDVVGDLLLQQRLVEVESLNGIFVVCGRVFREYPINYKLGLRTLLNVGEYLVYLVGNYVTVLVLTNPTLAPLLLLQWVVLLLCELFLQSPIPWLFSLRMFY